jgi:hypothetical protein
VKAIVLTTINVPKNVLQFIEKAEDEWVPIIVGDLKTPHEQVKAICQKTHGVYLSPDIQKTLGFAHADALPWNCYDRKNLGYLFALREGAEVIYSTDDDNYPVDGWDSYLKLGKQKIKAVSSPSGWWNCCSLGDADITPRGYPHWLIHQKNDYFFTEKEVDVGVQVGLWLGDPDVDAATRLVCNPRVTKYAEDFIALDAGTMCPYNSQNTFIARELVPAHMLWCCARTSAYRYDDIFAGYAAQKIASHYNLTVKFGRPLLLQERNDHDIVKDLKSEIGGMESQKDFFSVINDLQFSTDRKSHNLREIVYAIVERIPLLPVQLKTQVDTWCDDLARLGL